jgi:transketolase
MKINNKQFNDHQLTEMANAIRFLAIDAIENANSGHPGMVMGMADVATILFSEFLRFDAKNTDWPNRDRFILSAGHGSMLLYSLLYLIGCNDINIDDLKNFRQLDAKCAGHPEFGHLAAIETTTGPLGQGIGNAVGMAIGERILANRYDEYPNLFNHKTYCIVGDGCLMEGISQEAISLAGHLKLHNLIVLWDNNNISIDGNIDIACSDNMQLRFEACGWQVIKINGHNFSEIREALIVANKATKPVLIDCKTTIAFGSPNKSGSAKSHGSPLGRSEVEATRNALNWSYNSFEIPQHILDNWRLSNCRSNQEYLDWENYFSEISKKQDSKIVDLYRIINKELPIEFNSKINEFKQKIFLEKANQATRKSSQQCLEFLNSIMPELIGGSADLTESVLTKTSYNKAISSYDYSGNYIHYGIREHLMGAMMNGLALYGCFIPYGGTFLVFSDYMKPAIRLAALMKQRIIYILTHDSIGLGEDGPTHQPIEHLAMLRSIPNLLTFRPCDSYETIESFAVAISKQEQPSAIILSRQNLPFLSQNYSNDNLIAKGAYIISNDINQNNPQITIIASGSEVEIAIKAKELLLQHKLAVRVVSMACQELFNQQDKDYQDNILGKNNNNKPLIVAIEAAISQGWHRYIGSDGIFIGMNSFGASGKAGDLYRYFKITADDVYQQVLAKLPK